MATATKDVEQIVRKVVSEELDEAVNAIQELSTLLTDQVIPKLSGEEDSDDVDDNDDPVDDQDQDEDEESAVSMSAFNRGKASRRRRAPANGHNGSEDSDVEIPEREVPETVSTAFAELYKTLSPEQAKAFAELFTAMDDELEGEQEGEQEDEQDTEAVGRG